MPFAPLAAAAAPSLLESLFGGGEQSPFQQGLQRTGENAAGGLFGGLFTSRETNRRSRLRRRTASTAGELFANPEREGGPFSLLSQGFQDILGELEGFGEGRRASIEQGAKESSRSAQALLQGRGLGSSVLLANVERGSERQRQLLLGNLDDDVTQLRVGARSQNQQRLLAQQQLLANLMQV